MRMFPSYEIKDAIAQTIKDLHGEGRMCAHRLARMTDNETDVERWDVGVALNSGRVCDVSFCFLGAVGQFFGTGYTQGQSLLAAWGWGDHEISHAVNLNNSEGSDSYASSPLTSVENLLAFVSDTPVGTPSPSA